MRWLQLRFLPPSTVMKSKSCVNINLKRCFFLISTLTTQSTTHQAVLLSRFYSQHCHTMTQESSTLATGDTVMSKSHQLCRTGCSGISKLEYNMVQQLQQNGFINPQETESGFSSELIMPLPFMNSFHFTQHGDPQDSSLWENHGDQFFEKYLSAVFPVLLWGKLLENGVPCVLPRKAMLQAAISFSVPQFA